MTASTNNNIDFWARYFAVYDVLNHVIPYQNMLQKALASLNASAGDTVLDAGAGTGNWSELATRSGLTVTSLDASKEGLALYKRKDPHAHTVEHDMTHPLPFADDAFDHVCVINTIYALPAHSHEQVFKELFRVLKSGGRIVVVNLVEGYRPIRVYVEHIKTSVRSMGIVSTLRQLITLVVPTVKMFYYNKLLLKKTDSEMHLFTPQKQHDHLEKAGFVRISKGIPVLAEQAILHSAEKKI